MTVQRQPTNPIEARKFEVRRLSRQGLVTAGGSVVAGIVIGIAASHFFTWFVLGLVVAVALGGYHWMKIQKIVNHKDAY